MEDSKLIYIATFPELVSTGRGEIPFIDFKLGLDFALKARETPIREEDSQRLREEAQKIIKRYKLNPMGKIRRPYFFEEDSWMLKGAVVPGDSCDLSLDEFWIHECNSEYLRSAIDFSKKSKSDLPLMMGYMQHNVYNTDQASALIRLMTFWADYASERILE